MATANLSLRGIAIKVDTQLQPVYNLSLRGEVDAHGCSFVNLNGTEMHALADMIRKAITFVETE